MMKETNVDPKMITICHKSGRELTTIQILLSEWPSHQTHGDYLGRCVSNKGESIKPRPIENPE